MAKKQLNKTINPFFIKGTNPFSGINPFLTPEFQSPSVLNIDTETHFSAEEKADTEGATSNGQT